VEPKTHFATADEARAVVQPVLNAWELDAGLKNDPGALRFVYLRPEIVERNPPPGSAVLHAQTGDYVLFGEEVALRWNRNEYPAPPAGLVVSTEVDAMYDRFSRYKAGQVPLGPMADFCRTVFGAYDSHPFEIAADEGMARLWELRREMAYALDEYREDLRPLHPGDVTVPISAFPEIVRAARREADRRDLPMACYGHAGDGNLHYDILVDPDDEAMVERGEAAYAAVVEAAVDLGGTATGEHGVGLGKRQFMEREHGAASVAAMRSVKDALDPEGILNPGKVFPDGAE
jgi:FAD/FMN-containing dehydrogenase